MASFENFTEGGRVAALDKQVGQAQLAVNGAFVLLLLQSGFHIARVERGPGHTPAFASAVPCCDVQCPPVVCGLFPSSIPCWCCLCCVLVPN